MSAYKTATIRVGEAEYLRLREAEEQLRLLEQQKSEAQAFIEKKHRPAFGTINREIREREQTFSELASGLDPQLRDLESRTSDLLQRQNAQLLDEMARVEWKAGQESKLQIEQWSQTFEKQLRQHEQQINAYWHSQENRFRSLETRLESMQQDTRQWLEAALAWLEQIPVSYPNLNRFVNEFEGFNESCDQAIQLYEGGAVELAYMQSHQLYTGLSQFRRRLEADLVLTATIQKRLQDKTGEFYRRMQAQRVVKAMDSDGQELPDEIDVEYWTQGDYTLCLQEIMQFYSQVSQPGLTPDQLQSALDRRLPELEERSLELVTRARLEVLASQVRFNIAQIVTEALETQGFLLEEAHYDQQDYRKTFMATTRNASGNEVVVQIEPEPQYEEGGKLKIESKDAASVTQHELWQRNQEIFRAIQRYGLFISNISAGPEAAGVQTAVGEEARGEPIAARSVQVERSGYGRR
jgi:hypothetical protein